MLFYNCCVFVSVAKEDHSKSDCFVCAILSHGDSGIVYGTDGIIQLDMLINPFKGQRCRTLLGKPKVFIIQVGQQIKKRDKIPLLPYTYKQDMQWNLMRIRAAA